MIDSFSGRYRFLSNFYPCVVKLDESWYRSVEHAYQAAKFPPDQREVFLDVDLTPGQAKGLGRGKGGRDWYGKSLDVMLGLLQQKFREPKLRSLLLGTIGSELIEGNHWHDNFFGTCRCLRCGDRGSNMLGVLLMAVRDELAREEP